MFILDSDFQKHFRLIKKMLTIVSDNRPDK